MTIKEVEARTGLSRANVRFYEQEGLIAPERRENGYRDYSEADCRELEKIKLLRALGLSLEEIRAAKTGEEPLERLLEARLPQLTAEIGRLDSARDVCGQMCRDGVDYGSLVPDPYLTALYAPKIPWSDAVEQVRSPCRRFGARMLDGVICRSILLICIALFTDANLTSGIQLLLSVGALVMILLLEPLFLHLWGATPGKWVLGLSVQEENGGRLSWWAAWQRTLGVFLYGEGLHIPLVSEYRNYRSYRDCSDGKVLPWEEESVLVLRDERLWRTWAWVGSYVLCVSLVVAAALAQLMPDHQGPLTLEDYVANVNQQAQLLDLDCRMGEDGQWLPAPPPSEGTLVLTLESYTPPEYIYTLDEEGFLTGVEFAVHWSGGEEQMISSYQEERILPVLAFVRSRKGLFSSSVNPVLRQLESGRESSWEMEVNGVRIVNEVDYTGYLSTDFGFVLPNEAEEGFLDLHFSMTLAEEE